MLISKARHFHKAVHLFAARVRTREKEGTTNPAPFHTNLFGNADDLIEDIRLKWRFETNSLFFPHIVLVTARTRSNNLGSFKRKHKTSENNGVAAVCEIRHFYNHRFARIYNHGDECISTTSTRDASVEVQLTPNENKIHAFA